MRGSDLCRLQGPVNPHLPHVYLVASVLQDSHLTMVWPLQFGHLNSLYLKMASLPQLEHFLTMVYNYALAI
jgi:hypothetical protein